MQARDVMTSPVVTASPAADIGEIAKLLHDARISGVPVVDASGRLLGMVSEGDLMRRPETATERHSSWWLGLLASPQERAQAYLRSHGRRAADVMTRPVITVEADTGLADVAETLERNRIKRVPVMEGGRMVGIIARANLLHGLMAADGPAQPLLADDRTLRTKVEAALREAGLRTGTINVVVARGTVHLLGAVDSAEQRQAARVAAAGVVGEARVRERLGIFSPVVRSVLWAE